MIWTNNVIRSPMTAESNEFLKMTEQMFRCCSILAQIWQWSAKLSLEREGLGRQDEPQSHFLTLGLLPDNLASATSKAACWCLFRYSSRLFHCSPPEKNSILFYLLDFISKNPYFFQHTHFFIANRCHKWNLLPIKIGPRPCCYLYCLISL